MTLSSEPVGQLLTDLHTARGQPLASARDLTERFSLIAAATRKLADEIVETLE